MMSQGGEQKGDILNVFGKIKDLQDLDYVCCWFKKAAQLATNGHTEVSLVSTNSVSQGCQVSVLWKELYKLGMHINFAHRTFKWQSESSEMAAVHCVIISFAAFNRKEKYLFDNGTPTKVKDISPYLTEGKDLYVSPSEVSLCKIPKINMGNMERGNGQLFITEEQYEYIKKNESDLMKWVHPLIGAEELLKGKKRWCFWLEDVVLDSIKNEYLTERINKVKEFRLASSAKTTQSYAKIPHLFAQRVQPKEGRYIAIPVVTSENREYIPMASR